MSLNESWFSANMKSQINGGTRLGLGVKCTFRGSNSWFVYFHAKLYKTKEHSKQICHRFAEKIPVRGMSAIEFNNVRIKWNC